MQTLLVSLFVLLRFQGQIAFSGTFHDSNKGTMKQDQEKGRKHNALISEKSPYLLQHASNPVDWYPWGEQAFAKARAEDKPIFLSIGYSTCYWCHVMEREVFENDSIAELMNKFVVSIKVDREERPDIDRIYMAALQAMTGSGGWPMSMFLTPDRKPFFGATYIPPVAKYGRPGFPDIITRIHEVWTKDRNNILEAGEQIEDHIRSFLDPAATPATADRKVLDKGFESFSRSFEREYGGFSNAPKFPTPVSFNFLLRYYHSTGKAEALEMSLTTLKNMYRGGIYDHLGGGFHRYSTDARWHVPHFEKMLYDQAQLTVSYLEAFQVTQDPFYAGVARDILRYVQREMTHPGGGFYSAQDAESAVDGSEPSRKKEGAFSLWKQDEIAALLTSPENKLFSSVYDIQPNGNVRQDPSGEFSGFNVLHIVQSAEEAGNRLGMSPAEAQNILEAARNKLFLARERRPRPHLDDKILLSWNGLMISAFARASQVLNDREYLQAAIRASHFALNEMMVGGDLRRRSRDGDTRIDAQLEDYAFLVQALLDLYEASLDFQWMGKALSLHEKTIERFYDTAHGGFYDTGGSDSTLLLRTKEANDGAEPSGNAIAILNCLRLSQMTNNAGFAERAETSLRFFGRRMEAVPQGMAQFLTALDFSLRKPRQIILAAEEAESAQELLRVVHIVYEPNKVILMADSSARRKLSSMLPFLQNVSMIDGKATAYVCEDYSCKLPTNNPRVLQDQLTDHPHKDQGKSIK